MKYRKITKPDNTSIFVTDMGEVAICKPDGNGHTITYYAMSIEDCPMDNPLSALEQCEDTFYLYTEVDPTILDDYILASISPSYWSSAWSQKVIKDDTLFQNYNL